ncbi:hypothetical protein AGMMS49928_25330 [Spirochaetia bacterium]|nr:hypothetical protein AGMMS49928_25290 [Spirochaetia bacterium]GHV71794.1 hypothetical protein AGMMS49928_25330 [Spirochaetia bacterium]
MTDKESVRACQAEIRRLRRIIRDYAALIKDSLHIDYSKLFELWGDFDDSAAADEVNKIIEDNALGPFDAISFIACCFGYEQAMKKIREGL